MNDAISSISSAAAGEPSSAQRRLLDDQAGFASVLSRANESASPNPSRDAAEKLVAVAFVQPVLAKMRESGNAAPPFQPNAAEKSFRGMMDSALAQKIVKSSHWPLVDRIEAKLNRESPANALAAMRAQASETAKSSNAASSRLFDHQVSRPTPAASPAALGGHA